MTITETSRLTIRSLSADEDLPFILELFNEPGFIRFVGNRGIRTPHDARRYVEEQTSSYALRGYGLWAVELRESGQTIGICGLLTRPPLADVEIGFGYLERFGGRGYATEAAVAVLSHGREVLGLERIVAITASDNVGSITILERIGLTFDSLIELPGYEDKRKLFSLPKK